MAGLVSFQGEHPNVLRPSEGPSVLKCGNHVAAKLETRAGVLQGVEHRLLRNICVSMQLFKKRCVAMERAMAKETLRMHAVLALARCGVSPGTNRTSRAIDALQKQKPPVQTSWTDRFLSTNDLFAS